MSSQHQAGTQHTTTPHLNGYLKGIKDEFDRLNHELEETRKQRDQYITKYRNQVEELQELRQTVSRREEHIVCQRGQGEITHSSACRDTDDNSLISPVSSSSEYHSFLEEEEDSSTDRLHDPESAKEVGQFEGGRDEEGGDGPDNQITVEPTITGVVSLSPESNSTFTNKLEYSAWDVEFSSNTTAALNLNLVHKLTREGGAYATFSTDGKYLATASFSGIVSIFESKTGKRISVMKDLYHDEKSLPGYVCLGFSPDSKFLATGEEDGNVRIWIISQRRVRNTFRHQRTVSALNFSPDGRCLVTCSYDKTVIWGLRDGSLKVLTTFWGFPWSVRCSPDGRYIASGCTTQYILIWNMRTGKLVTEWRGHSGSVTSLVFTPDGKGLLSASWDKQVKHWDVASLGMADPLSSDPMEIYRLLGHKDTIRTVSISPDGKWIASGSWDKTVRIWNAQEATLHCILHCPGLVLSIDFSPVGNCLAIGGAFDDVTIWNYSVNL